MDVIGKRINLAVEKGPGVRLQNQSDGGVRNRYV
jgi:hypothetical protein